MVTLVPGTKYSHLEAIEVAGKNHRGETLVLCRCSCGKPHTATLYRLRKGETKSCGCLGTGSDPENLVGQKFNQLTVVEQAGRDKDRISLWKCICDCGNTTVVRRSSLLKSTVKSCGCYFRSNTCRLRGKAHPSYNPSLTDEERRANRRTLEHLEWRRGVLRKDDYRCQGCGRRGGRLVAHHLDSFDLNPSLRLDLGNGACLCVPCHRQFHSEYGMGKNTRGQFELWVWFRNLDVA